MRSRFSAFAVSDADYLLGTWHRSTRPATVELDGSTEWTRLDIVDSVEGGPFHTTGVVEFRAHYRTAAGRGLLHERSNFIREGDQWFSVTGELTSSGFRSPSSTWIRPSL
jgi:SEC-C motif-containing protein